MRNSYIIKIIIYLYITAHIIINSSSITTIQVILFLSLVISDIIFEKYIKNIYILILELLIVTLASRINHTFAYACLVIVFNAIYSEHYYLSPLPVIAGYIFLSKSSYDIYSILNALLIFTGHYINSSEIRDKKYKASVDNERRLRYDLEKTKNLLIRSNDEIAHLTQVKERNRIARELHDSIGHNLTGIFMQLQVAYKLFDRNEGKSKEELKNSINSMSHTIELVRDTVHDLKPAESTGIDYIKSIIDNFKFCPIDFKYTGDFNKMPVSHYQILAENLIMALTNIIKYSNATHVDVQLDTNYKYSRMFIKDNGKGTKIINEGLGISGMKERVKNVGGNISIDSSDGFLIVCMIPCNMGDGFFENYDS